MKNLQSLSLILLKFETQNGEREGLLGMSAYKQEASDWLSSKRLVPIACSKDQAIAFRFHPIAWIRDQAIGSFSCSLALRTGQVMGKHFQTPDGLLMHSEIRDNQYIVREKIRITLLFIIKIEQLLNLCSNIHKIKQKDDYRKDSK